MKWFFQSETLTEKSIQEKGPGTGHFFRWLLSKEMLEEKPILEKNKKGFFRWLMESV